jgi:hypothetical protein
MDSLPTQEQFLSFEEMAKKKGYAPEYVGRKNEYKSVSHIFKAKGKDGKPIFLRFDLKKAKNLKQNQDWIWIEFKNSEGENGWIHGDSHFVAFERQKDFVIVNRSELLSWLSSGKKIRYDLPFVSLAKKAKYRIYKRAGKKDEITQIHFKDLKKLESFQVWNKEYAEPDQI